MKTPVLFITFARPQYAIQTFEKIRKARPPRLYFYSNKARIDKPEEIQNNNRTRELINQVDWDCDLRLFFRDEYVDLNQSILSAIDWIFDNEEQAIILEEDCVASLSFFNYCDILLNKYENNDRIWIVTARNHHLEYKFIYDYYYSYYSHIHGWASWKNIWIKYKTILLNNTFWPEFYKTGGLENSYSSQKEGKYYNKFYAKHYYNGKFDLTWDYMFNLIMLLERNMAIIPSKNLVKNIGSIGEHSYFTLPAHKLEYFENFIIKSSPRFILPNRSFEEYHYLKHVRTMDPPFPYSIWNKVINKFKLYITKYKTFINGKIS